MPSMKLERLVWSAHAAGATEGQLRCSLGAAVESLLLRVTERILTIVGYGDTCRSAWIVTPDGSQVGAAQEAVEEEVAAAAA